jgi:hypothetical protein
MNINFEKSKRLQTNIENAFDVLCGTSSFLEVRTKYKKNESGNIVRKEKYLAYEDMLNDPIMLHLARVLWSIYSIPYTRKNIEYLPGYNAELFKREVFDSIEENSPIVRDIDTEFMQNLENLDSDSIKRLVNLYRIQWKGHIPKDCQTRFDNALNYPEGGGGDLAIASCEAEHCDLIDHDEARQIFSYVGKIAYSLDNIGKELEALFEKWEGLTQTAENHNVERGSLYTICDGRKTDFIKIISAMFDCRMFGATDGNVASNKKDLIKALGVFFNAEIDDYSGLLSNAKTKTKKETFLEIFDKLKEKGGDYYGE